MLKTIIVNENEGIQRIEKFLIKTFPFLTYSQIFKLIRTKEIRVNDVKVQIGFKIKPKDVIKIWLPKNVNLNKKEHDRDFLKINQSLKIIYEDENIIIIDKEVNIPCQPIKNSNKISIQELLLKHMLVTNQWTQEQSFTPSICNRLDTNTIGLVLAAKNGIALQELNMIFKEREIEKFYKALVFGLVPNKQQTEKAYLYKDSQKKIVKIFSKKLSENYLTIITEYKLLKHIFNKNMSLLEVKLITGRTHQIRAHMSYLNHPIVGDHKYGLDIYHEINKKFKHQALHAFKLKFKKLNEFKYPKLAYLSNKEFCSNQNSWFEKF